MIAPTVIELATAMKLDPQAFNTPSFKDCGYTGKPAEVAAVWRAVAALTKPKHFGRHA